MDINSLEKLACLKIAEEDKEDLSNSLDGIMQTLQEVTKINVDNAQENFNNQTVFREEEYQKPNLTGLNVTEEGYFLAPKVIRKE